ncbi:bifunctional metallophosphatase/5'-nucleotidase [Methylobacterium sp. WL103]|uniref:bifunctional metallophosphatase/5'-nucleotidase n=1 Tax=Methylobacterium sp. WL103 TaxID=2603891 RepID=UPI0011C83740|nr:bifunctional UDP-sugar hydrolase/5'-nucleotidase [Methylobacterium sp. WL103]TXM93348.1 bifunctional metallophosphatase/5'-nucleotidase [Methylobacterium sp. WL103]
MPPPNRRQTFGLGAGLVAGLATPARAAEASPEPTLTLLLVNDVYLMGEVAGRGGFARLNAIVKAERARGVAVLYVHAGDTLSPSLMSGLDKGGHIVDLLNIAAPDVFVPGNHEFDFGPETFLERMRAAAFPCFAANLRDGAGGAIPGIRDRTILTLGGVRVGIVGIALASTPEKSQSGDLRFGPELATLAEQAKALRSEGADLVVAVTHTARPTDLAMLEAGYADIVLSGHDHDLVVHYDGRRVLAESSSDAHYVTAIDLFATISVQGETSAVSWRPSFRIHDSSYVVPDPETLALVRRLEADLSRRLDVPVGDRARPLDSRIAAVRAREASFGNLVADALREATQSDIAVMNGGGIRGNRLYPAGTVLTRRDILTELPFGNTIVSVAITGAQVRALLETGLGEFGRPAGRFVQVSGLTVRVDPDAPAGARIVSVQVGGAPLDEARTYRVASNNFLYEGGNGYGMLAQGRTLVGATDGGLVANAVIDYVARHAPIAVREGERILVGR